MSPWHNPRPRDRYTTFRRALIVIAVLFAIAILIGRRRERLAQRG